MSPPGTWSRLDRSLLRLLQGLAGLHVLGGLLLPLVIAGQWLPPGWLPEGQDFGIAVFGPTIASWGLLMLVLLRQGVALGQRWACDALLAAVLVWAPLDALVCLAWNYTPGLVLDGLVAPLLLIPLLRLRRHCR